MIPGLSHSKYIIVPLIWWNRFIRSQDGTGCYVLKNGPVYPNQQLWGCSTNVQVLVVQGKLLPVQWALALSLCTAFWNPSQTNAHNLYQDSCRVDQNHRNMHRFAQICTVTGSQNNLKTLSNLWFCCVAQPGLCLLQIHRPRNLKAQKFFKCNSCWLPSMWVWR